MLMSTKSGHCHGIARFLSILSCSASLATTRVCNTVTALLKNAILESSFLLPAGVPAGLIWFKKQKCPLSACAPAEKDIKIARVRFNEHRLCSILLSFRLHVVCQTSPYSILKSISDFFVYALKILISQ